MTTNKPHDKADVAITAVAAFTGLPLESLKYVRSNLLRNMLHIHHVGSQDMFIYSTHTGTVYPPPYYHTMKETPPF